MDLTEGGAQMAAMEPDGDEREPQVSVLAGISAEMTRLYKEQFGRGPTRVRTEWAGPNALITFLEDTLTPSERNLVKLGEHQKLRDIRLFFQYATVKDFCEPVERLTGRKVRSFQSAIDTEAGGLATEVYVLHPPGYEGPSRKEQSAV